MTNEPLIRDKSVVKLSGYTIGEIILRGITAEVRERQHDDGKARW